MFNEAISSIGLNEIKLSGKKYTWSNLQDSPLLEQLDWVFVSSTWLNSYPNTTARLLTMQPSDHNPCVVNISTDIPKSKIFRLENYWMHHNHFLPIIQNAWSLPCTEQDPAKRISAKFKVTRQVLKKWQNSLPSLKTAIANVKALIQFMEVLGEFRDLTLQEWNFK